MQEPDRILSGFEIPVWAGGGQGYEARLSFQGFVSLWCILEGLLIPAFIRFHPHCFVGVPQAVCMLLLSIDSCSFPVTFICIDSYIKCAFPFLHFNELCKMLE